MINFDDAKLISWKKKKEKKKLFRFGRKWEWDFVENYRYVFVYDGCLFLSRV